MTDAQKDIEGLQNLVKAQAEFIRVQEQEIRNVFNSLQRCLTELAEIEDMTPGFSSDPELLDDLRKTLGYPTDEDQ